jgi:hypothetical protein
VCRWCGLLALPSFPIVCMCVLRNRPALCFGLSFLLPWWASLPRPGCGDLHASARETTNMYIRSLSVWGGDFNLVPLHTSAFR